MALATLVAFNAGTAGRPPSSAVLPTPGEGLADLASRRAADPVPGPGSWDPRSWPGIVAGAIDRTTLAADAVSLSDGANVFAARIVDGGPSPAYALYEAGGGAFSTAFLPGVVHQGARRAGRPGAGLLLGLQRGGAGRP